MEAVHFDSLLKQVTEPEDLRRLWNNTLFEYFCAVLAQLEQGALETYLSAAVEITHQKYNDPHLIEFRLEHDFKLEDEKLAIKAMLERAEKHSNNYDRR